MLIPSAFILNTVVTITKIMRKTQLRVQ